MMDVLDLIAKIGAGENSITEREFVSPIFNNTLVATRVCGLIYAFTIPKTNPGWYKIRPIDGKRARIIGPADPMEIEQYQKFLDRVRLVLVMKNGPVYMAIPDKANKFGFASNELLPIFLTDDTVMDFDRVLARFDGSNFWFESVDLANDPTKADYLRISIEKLLDPKKIKFSGLTFEEKLAYSCKVTLDKKFVEDKKKLSLKEDVEHAGGKFVRFAEKSDHFSVTYKVDGEEFTSTISKDPRHMVITAGICLQNNDKTFNLKSLITVVREAQDRDIVHRM
jgi:hypothetical protein